MTAFTIAAFLILVAALALMAWPLLRTRNTISYERQAQNIHYAKERLQELEDQLKNASISATDYEALKLEIESNLASDIDLAERTNTAKVVPPRRSNKVLITALIVVFPIAAFGLYWATGTPSALNEQAAEADRPTPEQVQQMLAQIEQRLVDNPSDTQGWRVLARTYLAMGRFADAQTGFLKLLELEGESVEVLTSLADTSGLMAGGDMSGQPMQYVQRALALEPDNPQALWLAGLGSAQQNQPAKARQYWNKLLPLLANNPQQQAELQTIIKQTFESQAIPSDSTDQTTTAGLTLTVSLDESMLEQVSEKDLVFVFARAKSGPPAPLAVKRLTVADLPATVNLSDSDAMMAQFKLSLFDDVVVSARVAKSGNPVAQAGDIQSALVDSKNDNSDEIKLIISDVIE